MPTPAPLTTINPVDPINRSAPTAAQSAVNSNPQSDNPNGPNYNPGGATLKPVAGPAPFGSDPVSGVPYGSPTSNNPAPAAPAAAVEQPAGQVYGKTGNPDLDAALAQQAAAAKAAAGQPDPNDLAVQASIRSQTLASFQAEIDATNAMYADKLATAKVAGQGRLGSATAEEARGGLLGSDFGTAQTETVNQGNQSIYSSIQDEQNSAIQAILTKSRDAGTKAIADKTAARSAGLDSYVKYLQDSQTRTQTNATAAAKAILQAHLDPTTLTPDQLNTYITNYGISKDDLSKAYAAEKPGFDAAAAAAKKAGETTVAQGAEVIGSDGKVIATNPKETTLPASAQEYEYAVKTAGYKGTYTQWLNEDANRKNPAPSTAGEQTVINDFGKSLVDKASAAALKDGTITREDLIRTLTGQYGGNGKNQINPADIARKVYETYPDKSSSGGKPWWHL